MNHPSTLKLSRGQENMLKSIMKSTDNKKDYRRLLAILQKGEGRTYHDIAKEHGVSSRSVQRWVAAYIKKGIDDGVRMKKPGGLKSRITDRDTKIILSALFDH